MASSPTIAPGKRQKSDPFGGRLRLAAGGLEAEFTVIADGTLTRPEDLFGDPRGFITVPLMHRTGKSFHLPGGAALYFDTGVIEVATPPMELEPGCFGRLARSLDEAVRLVRQELDGWEQRTTRRIELQGFSTHYNVSLPGLPSGSRRMSDLAWALVHVLPAPVMLLATNRLSSGVGVRPRPGRIEVTADYSPDALRVSATGAIVAGIVKAVVRAMPTLDELRHRVPVVTGFLPTKHTSRKGWLARFDCYPLNPFACDPDAAIWPTSTGMRTLRDIARRVAETYDTPIRRVADPASYRLARRIVSGASASWLDETERPEAYDDVGRDGEAPSSLARLGWSRYERVIRDVVARRALRLDGEWWTPVRVKGWSQVELERDRDRTRVIMSLDAVLGKQERAPAMVRRGS
jgi:hypothetical protein